MDLQTSKQTIAISDIILDTFLEQGVECDMILPDYCPDVVKILKCSVTPVILSTQLSGDKVEAEGSASIRLYYLSEGGGLYCYEQKYPFEKTAELKETPLRPVAEASATLDYVNCRAMSQRRVDIRGAVTVHLKVEGQKEQNVISTAQGGGICLRSQMFPITKLIGTAARQFTIREELDPVPGSPAVESILHAYGCAALTEYKVISGKIIAKGELRLQLLYRPQGDSSQGEDSTLCPATMEYRLPISQILDIEGAEEGACCEVRFEPGDIIVTLKNEGAPGEEKISLSALMFAKAKLYANVEISLVDDCYSTLYACTYHASPMRLEQTSAMVDEHRQQRASIELPEEASGEVLSLWGDISAVTLTEEGLSAQLDLHLLACDGEGVPVYFERALEIPASVPLQPGEEMIEPRIQLEDIGYSRSGERLELSCDLRVTCRRCISHIFSAIQEINVDETHPKPQRTAALTIFFARKGESLWEIARQYSTSMEAIMEENSLSEEILPENRMLMIPMVTSVRNGTDTE